MNDASPSYPNSQETRPQATMSASAPAHTEPNRLEQYLAELDAGQKRLGVTSIERRVEILAQCRDHIAEVRHDWVTAACEAKGIPAGSRMRMEEVLAGPATAMRQLQLFLHTMREIARNGRPKLPGRVTHRPD